MLHRISSWLQPIKLEDDAIVLASHTFPRPPFFVPLLRRLPSGPQEGRSYDLAGLV